MPFGPDGEESVPPAVSRRFFPDTISSPMSVDVLSSSASASSPAPPASSASPDRSPVTLGRQWLLWTVLGLIPFAQELLSAALTSVQSLDAVPWPDIPRALLYHLPIWWIWLPATPLIAVLALRFPVLARRGLYAAAVHLPAGILCALGQLVIAAWWRTTLFPGDAVGWVDLLQKTGLQMGLFAYWGILATVTARRVYGELSERKMDNSRLRYRLVQARIRALKTQLQPHFMFNALNAVSMLLIRRDGPGAERMLNLLGEFVRLTLSDAGLETRLADDVALAVKYLSIEQVRFEDRLRFDVQLDPAVAGARVPQLLLEPVVENAVKHGISPKARGGTIKIQAELRTESRATDSGRRVHIVVSDDGAGLSRDRAIGRRQDGGIGLFNTKDRLQHLYGDDFELSIEGAPDEGTRVTFDLPFRSTPAAEPETWS